MSKTEEILNDWDAADEALQEQIDKIVPVVDAINNKCMIRKITNKEIAIELPAHGTFLMLVQSGDNAELYMIYTTDKVCICKVASNFTSAGLTTLGTASVTGFTLTFQPTEWLCYTLVSLK